jgi:O-antigen ligase
VKKLESALFFAFMAVLVWAPLPFASNRSWGGGLLAAMIGLILAIWLVLYLLGRVNLVQGIVRPALLPLALLLTIQLWVLFQLLPLPSSIVAWLSPRALAWHIDAAWLSLSLDGAATRDYLLRGITYTVAFFLTLALVNSGDRLRMMLQVLVFSGTFQAAYGAFMVLSGMELGFFVEKYAGQGVATGTFVNRNHLAGYLVMCLSAGIGLLLSQLVPVRTANWKERLQHALQLLLSSKIRLRIYLAVMVIALVLTRSRMGNVAFFSALGLAGFLYVYAQGRFSPRIIFFLGSLVVVDLLILGRWFGLDKLVDRLESTNPDTEGRVWSNAYTLDYIQAFPLTGSGGGSYYGIFPNFQPADLPGYYDHAHNDYLEFAAELGIPATALLIAVAAIALRVAFGVMQRRRTLLCRGAAFTVCMTVCWAAIHSFADFNLQITANALTFVSILALAFVAQGVEGERARPRRV